MAAGESQNRAVLAQGNIVRDCVYCSGACAEPSGQSSGKGFPYRHARLAQPPAGRDRELLPLHPFHHFDGGDAPGGKAGGGHIPRQQGDDRHAGDRRNTVYCPHGGEFPAGDRFRGDRGGAGHRVQQLPDYHEGTDSGGEALSHHRRDYLDGDDPRLLCYGCDYRRHRTWTDCNRLWPSAEQAGCDMGLCASAGCHRPNYSGGWYSNRTSGRQTHQAVILSPIQA